MGEKVTFLHSVRPIRKCGASKQNFTYVQMFYPRQTRDQINNEIWYRIMSTYDMDRSDIFPFK